MKLTIESTSGIVEVNGIPARVWEGVSERGVKVQCLVTRIAVHNNDDSSQFEAELRETAPPTAPERAFPLRMIL
jgi:hypothetical protein